MDDQPLYQLDIYHYHRKLEASLFAPHRLAIPGPWIPALPAGMTRFG